MGKWVHLLTQCEWEASFLLRFMSKTANGGLQKMALQDTKAPPCFIAAAGHTVHVQAFGDIALDPP